MILELRLNDPSALVTLAQHVKKDFFSSYSMFLRLHVYYASDVDRLVAYLGKSASNGDVYLGEIRKRPNTACEFRGKLWLSLWDEIVDVFGMQEMTVTYHVPTSKGPQPELVD